MTMFTIATKWHELAVADPVVGHAFESGFAEDHTERLAAYLAEALGGPEIYTQTFGNGAAVLRMHAGNGVHPEFDEAGIALFDRAVDAAGVPHPEAAEEIKKYWAWATRGPLNEHPDTPDTVPTGATVLHWTWGGPSDG